MLSLARKNVVAIVAATALTMDLVDTTAIVVALPTIQNEVPGADAASAGFVVTAYLVALAVSMTAAGWLTRRFGTRATFTAALLVFVVGSATCALAPNIGVLVAARVLQGLGGGVLVPVSLAAVLNAFPSDERNRASAIVSVPASVAPALGPLLGGAFTTGGDWRWLFLVNVPLGIAAAVIAARVLPGDRSDHAPFDLRGFVTGAVAVAALVVGLGSIGDATVLGLVLLVVGVVAVVLFVRHELRLRSPLLHLRLFGHTEMKWGITVMLAASVAYSALLLIVPSARQELLDESAFISGTLLTSHAVGVLVATPLAPRIVRRFGGRRVLVVGMVATAATTATLVAVVGAPFLAAAMVLFLGGFAFGLCVVPLQTVPFAAIDPDEMGQATSMLSLARQLGAALGPAVATTTILLFARGTFDAAGFEVALGLAAIAAAAGVAGSMRLPAEQQRAPR